MALFLAQSPIRGSSIGLDNGNTGSNPNGSSPDDYALTPSGQRAQIQPPRGAQTSRSARGPASTQEREVEPFNPFAASSEPDVNPDHDQELDSRDDDMDTSQETSHLSHFKTVLGVNVQQEQLANELALMTRAERNAALLTCLAAVVKRLDQTTQAIGAVPTPAIRAAKPVSPLSHEYPVRTHVYSPVFKQFVKNVGRACMLNEEIEAYNTNQQENLLYRAVMVRLDRQMPVYKRTHLPPNYMTHDPRATAHVIAQVRTQLKHVRHKARNVLLTGTQPSGNITYVPPIDELSRMLWRHFTLGHNTLSNVEVDAILLPRPLLRI
ncbi:hypothetical protein PCASD_06319 [Puccinia coronata f. sp. avenae]|uniref:Uncharacterized protein n=1 Tax=Puccinia coronata f. sp. avenae TaxID=200324 RepID=A0A2N5V961_9BASI|nr:hypothetical protein PCASD_06319 [Puccinia coronata f. sp. avenae]